jgi:hypothetical protein
MMVDGKKTTAGEQLKTNKKNIWFIPSFDEAFLNGNFRILHSQLNAKNITVFGMPTWLNGDILRLDYVSTIFKHTLATRFIWIVLRLPPMIFYVILLLHTTIRLTGMPPWVMMCFIF